MRALVRQEMEEGALGIGSVADLRAGSYANTEELIELCKVAARYRGKYISHMRSEGDRLLEAVDELIRIAARRGVPAEIYHLKAAGEANWPKMDAGDRAGRGGAARGAEDHRRHVHLHRRRDRPSTPACRRWAQDGGYEALLHAPAGPATRARGSRAEMRTPAEGWENLCLAGGLAERVLLVGFKNDALQAAHRQDAGRGGAARGTDPGETILDLVLEDRTRVGVGLLPDVRGQRPQADPAAVGRRSAPTPRRWRPRALFPKSSTHPRAYGNFARLLGKYVRDEKLIPLEEAIRRLTALPADEPGPRRPRTAEDGLLRRRRRLRPGHDRRPRDLRAAAPVRGGHAPRVRQRRARCCATASTPAPLPGRAL